MAHREPQYAAPQYSAVAPAVSYSFLPYAAGYKYYYNWGQGGGGGRSRGFSFLAANSKLLICESPDPIFFCTSKSYRIRSVTLI